LLVLVDRDSSEYSAEYLLGHFFAVFDFGVVVEAEAVHAARL
jgi:hypothetical protein